jgi:16S rRNA (cytosine1402-N4)-methyltransferase
LLGLDLDPQALALASQRLHIFGGRAVLLPASYTSMRQQLALLGWPAVDGIVIDLGVSSMQLDNAERGFSFLSDGPLDMRFGPLSGPSAADLVNTLPEAELAQILWKYGEEQHSRRIARAICMTRPLSTTSQLAAIVLRAAGGRKSGHHPATRTFQALRIAVNHELQSVEEVLPEAVAALKPGGRLAVISFHSLEDRLVKQYFRQESRDCICPPERPVCTCGHKASIREITRRPLSPADAETAQNPRSRSAKLRIIEKLEVAQQLQDSGRH